MDAIVTAGGIPEQGEPLYDFSRGEYKALLDIASKPMVQWVLDAIDDAKTIERVVLIGLPEDIDIKSQKLAAMLPTQGDMLENIRGGVKKILEINPDARHTVIVSSDIPSITGEMVDWAVNAAMQSDEDIYYNVIEKSVMEKRFPTSNRSYTFLKDIAICGADLNIIRTMTVTSNDKMWRKIIAARKNVFKQAALVGYDTLVLLLLRAITLEDAVKVVTKRLNVTGRAIVCPYAEIGMDIDKPHQLEILRADLAQKQGA
ncbi:MAG: nucleotidyltransferase family protein [Anaerolineales bacterium]|nr:nucleotidyltransferase family protein [Anaerolineales bacterium]